MADLSVGRRGVEGRQGRVGGGKVRGSGCRGGHGDSPGRPYER